MEIGNFGAEVSMQIQWEETERKYKNTLEISSEDYMTDQLTIFEEFDPFTGQKNKKK